MCKRIQSAGKAVQLSAGYNEVEPILEELDPRRLLIMTHAPDVEAAEALLKNAEHWSCKGVHAIR